jgi:hypothetical protein
MVGTAILVVLGGTALAIAMWITFDGAHTVAPIVEAGTKRPQRFQEAIRQLSAMFGAGFVCGLLVTGFGGRLFMRMVAITSDDAAQGRLTEADELVGEVTLGGSVFFIVFASGFGVLGVIGLFLFRPWLPRRSIVAGLVVAGIGAALLARPTDFLAPGSIDFEILGPRWFAGGFALGLIVLLGTATATLADRWVRLWPAPELSIRGVVGLIPLAPLVLLGPGVVIIPVLLLQRTFLPQGRGEGRRSTSGLAIYGIVIAAGLAGWAWTLIAVGEILA